MKLVAHEKVICSGLVWATGECLHIHSQPSMVHVFDEDQIVAGHILATLASAGPISLE